jgi:predicted Fe-S protein YdhL (DUF1289 family)
MNFTPPAPLTPCIKVCVVDPLSGLCVGCGRTVAEISVWPELADEARRAIMSGLPERMAATRSRGARSGRIRSGAGRRATPP